MVLPAPGDAVWSQVPLELRQGLRPAAHALVNPARGRLSGTPGRPLRLALSALTRAKPTGAHWHVLLTSPREAFGGKDSTRAQRMYELLEQAVAQHFRPTFTHPAAPEGGPAEAWTAPAAADRSTARRNGPVADTPARVTPRRARAAAPDTAVPATAPPEDDAAAHTASAARENGPEVEPPGTAAPVASAPATSAPAGDDRTAAGSHAASIAPGNAPGAATPTPRAADDTSAAVSGIAAPATARPATVRSATDDSAAAGPPPSTVPVPTTLHEARGMLPQLVRAAAGGIRTPLSRGTHHAVLTTPADARTLGWDVTGAPTHGIADARRKLGDLVHEAAEGRPQVLRRHTTPVAVLLPAATGAVPVPPTDAPAAPATPSGAPASAAAVSPATPFATGPEAASPTAAPVPPAVRPAALGTPAAPENPLPASTAPPSAAPAAPLPPAAAPDSGTTQVGARAPRGLAVFGDVLDTVLAPPVATAVPSLGIRVLDDLLGGLHQGRFYLVAAAPGAGGSLLASAAARTTALERALPVLYAASGLTRTDIAARIVAAHLPVDYGRLRAGRLNPGERDDAATLHGELAAAPLYIDDGADLTAAAVAHAAAEIRDLALVVVDRLQTTPDPRLPLSGPAVADAVQALAHLARTRNVPVLAVVDSDLDDSRVLGDAPADVTVLLTGHPTHEAHWVHAGVSERDLGPIGDAVLLADLAHARLLDPPAFPPAPDPARTAVPPTAPSGPAGSRVRTPAAGRHSRRPGLPQRPAPPAPGPADVTAPGAWPPVTRPGTATRPTAHATEAPSAAPPTPPAPRTAAAPTLPDTAMSTASSVSVTSVARPARRTAPPGPVAHRSTPSPAGEGYAGRDYSDFTAMIVRAVDQALAEHGGDIEAATEALVKKAVPNGTALFEATRVGSNYDHTVYPELPDFLRKKTRDGVDEVWEGRHNWSNEPLLDQLRAGTLPPATVDVLDTNAAFLSALKTHLPIGRLTHETHNPDDPDDGFHPRRSGIYLLNSRPTWDHPDLPDPIGNRHEQGEILLDDATVRLLFQCARLGLCAPPAIAESWTSGSSEGLLEKFRRVLTEARAQALGNNDTVTVEYIKAMYAKFVSTMGESSANRDIRRPDWMHIIRSQAFANLWRKGYKARANGLTIVRMRGVDELHVTGGNWRDVFPEGRRTAETKTKDQYILPKKAA
ncbi:type II toxin-antitoxin system prevent-host-death family antitoxin [Yinghuangia sp. ASG 101]|uniref:type II toxin-antitoxin system prevent-host-death family antitoxin n=1 Tax=Yinghuangia sp. ASG 101 TaxID=2896848 RepID=UPI0022B22CB9|nr:type II toxin-antitoxin system prevent-host-death family antitoxin [Yinghuangia sp. ASG 101]